MVVLYYLGIRLYYLLALILSPFKRKANLWIKGRKNWAARLKASVSPNHPVAWFHCASLGEFEQGRSLIEGFRRQHPDHRILLTFFSPSGYEVRKNHPLADYVFYLPLDTPRNARTFVSIVNPSIAIFIKYEFWFHFLKTLKEKAIPTFVVSANFRPNQIFFKWYGWWYRKFLFGFQHIFVQNELSVRLLQSIGISNASAAGDTRFDRVYANAMRAEPLPILDAFCAGSRVIVAGSTWPKDEELLVEFMKAAPGDVKLVVAPHEIGANQIELFEKRIGVPTLRYTGCEGKQNSARVLIIDIIGILASAYRYANVAYVGGGFGVGIHNTLEPASFGIPVVFGPHYTHFNEAVDLATNGAGFPVANATEFKQVVLDLLNDTERYKLACKAAKEYVGSNIGASNRILEMMKPHKL